MAYPLTQGTVLGAPDLYRAPDELRRTLGAERMDVCAFVGVAPRGPARVAVEPEHCPERRAYVRATDRRRRSVAVAVESWDEYRRLYGGLQGPGLLPHAVASFFEQGGRRAYIVRIVPGYGDPRDFGGLASGQVSGLDSTGGDVILQAKNEGSWGGQLRAALGFSLRPLQLEPGSSASELKIPPAESCPPGSLLRLAVPAPGGFEYQLRFVARREERGLADSAGREEILVLQTAAANVPVAAELVEATFAVEDGEGNREAFDGLGLAPEHPRFLATALYRESRLVNPTEGWLDASLTPADPERLPLDSRRELRENPIPFSRVEDRFGDIRPQDFFDSGWLPGNPEPGEGVHALAQIRELALLVVPDLYAPAPAVEEPQEEPIQSLAGDEFAPCVDLAPAAEPLNWGQHQLPHLQLDPLQPSDLQQIVQRQQQLVALAAQLRRFIVLLDAPPGISQRRLVAWRGHFDSAFCAAYFPWLKVSDPSSGESRLRSINPSAAAAGIIARSEFAFGVHHGPANAIAESVVMVEEKISRPRHDQLHPLGINIFLPERDGVRLSAARTLSRDAAWRQLSVRRLMTMLQRVLHRQMQWLVFENNNRELRTQLRFLLVNFLRQLYLAGAFRGRSEAEAFFVRCDERLNDLRVRDAGRLVAEIGVAPVEPMEFILLRLVREGDGTLGIET